MNLQRGLVTTIVTFAVVAGREAHQLRVTVTMEGRRNEPAHTINQVYDRSS